MSSDRNQDDFASLFEASTPTGARTERARSLALGEAVRAEVVQVGRTGVFVEVLGRGDSGKRPEAFLEAIDLQDSSGVLTAKVGDVIEAIVVAIERTGAVRLGRSMGAPAGLDELARAHAGRVPVDGKVAAANKGGLEVELAGLRAFCPNSQIERAFVADPQSYVGRSLQFLVTELRDNGRRIVLSRRALLEQESAQARAHTLATLQVGAVVRGSVTAVREFGAFVDLGGVEGLIPTSELSYERGRKAADLLSPGDVVEVQVRALSAQPAEARSQKSPAAQRSEPALKITLSLKALAADPWTTVREQIPEGKVLRGTVTRVVDFGAFVQLAPGIEGLLHVSELSGKPAHPSTVCSVGQQLNVVVRTLDADAKKIGLAPAPDGLAIGSDARGPALVVAAIVSGTVDRIEPFGLFLQLEGTRGRAGRGLIPNVELGVPRGADLRKLFPLGTRLTAKVLETGEGKLRLSVRAVKDDEERAEFDGYRATQAAEKLGTFADLFKKK